MVFFIYFSKNPLSISFFFFFSPLNKIQFPFAFFFVVLTFHSVKAIFSTIWEVFASALVGCSYSTIQFDPNPTLSLIRIFISIRSHRTVFPCLCEPTFFLLGSLGGLDFLPRFGSFQNRYSAILLPIRLVQFRDSVLAHRPCASTN